MSIENSENPYAYNPGNRGAVPQSWEHKAGSIVPSNQEPRTPFEIFLKQGRYRCRMTVYETHLVIEGENINEPLTLDRSEAGKAIKFLSLNKRLCVRMPESGKKHKFYYQKMPDKELLCARLDVWANGSFDATPDVAYREVEANVVKHCTWNTRSNLMVVGILMLLSSLSMLGLTLALVFGVELDTTEDKVALMVIWGMIFLVGFTAATICFVFKYLLHKRNKKAMFGVVIFSIVMALSGNLILIVVLVYTILENSNLTQQLKFLEDDNRPSVPYAPPRN